MGRNYYNNIKSNIFTRIEKLNRFKLKVVDESQYQQTNWLLQGA